MELAEKIANGNGMVSEFPLFTRPDKKTFPIATDCGCGPPEVGIPKVSGSLIAANPTIRAVYAVPGPIDAPSSACNDLLPRRNAGPSAVDLLGIVKPYRFHQGVRV